jgi:hypothetical protein
VAAGINGLFGLYKTYNADVIRTIDDKNNNNQVINKMLICEKLSIILLHIICGPILCPLNLLHFFNQLEIIYRNDKMSNYNYKNNKRPRRLIGYCP